MFRLNTIANKEDERKRRGETDNITRVNFHPLDKLIMTQHKNVETY